jgi:hypothetical protein
MTTSRRISHSLPDVATLRCDRTVQYKSRRSVTPLAQDWLKASLVRTSEIGASLASREP